MFIFYFNFIIGWEEVARSEADMKLWGDEWDWDAQWKIHKEPIKIFIKKRKNCYHISNVGLQNSQFMKRWHIVPSWQMNIFLKDACDFQSDCLTIERINSREMRLSPSILCWEKEKVPSSQRTLE